MFWPCSFGAAERIHQQSRILGWNCHRHGRGCLRILQGGKIRPGFQVSWWPEPLHHSQQAGWPLQELCEGLSRYPPDSLLLHIVVSVGKQQDKQCWGHARSNLVTQWGNNPPPRGPAKLIVLLLLSRRSELVEKKSEKY